MLTRKDPVSCGDLPLSPKSPAEVMRSPLQKDRDRPWENGTANIHGMAGRTPRRNLALLASTPGGPQATRWYMRGLGYKSRIGARRGIFPAPPGFRSWAGGSVALAKFQDDGIWELPYFGRGHMVRGGNRPVDAATEAGRPAVHSKKAVCIECFRDRKREQLDIAEVMAKRLCWVADELAVEAEGRRGSSGYGAADHFAQRAQIPKRRELEMPLSVMSRR